MALEAEIQKAIMDYLKYKHIFVWRNNTGSFRLGDRYFRAGKKGSADIIGILPGGRFLAIEVKRPGAKTTVDQQDFLGEITRNGGLAFVANSVDVVERVLKSDWRVDSIPT